MKVLLVEDDKVSQIVCKHYLEKLNCEVELAETGNQAIAAITHEGSNKYDAMVLDLGLPDRGGESVVIAIRHYEENKRCVPLPIIVVTAHLDNVTLGECLKLGATQALSKPISYHQLRNFLDNLAMTA